MNIKLTTPAAVAASLAALLATPTASAADYAQAAGSTLAFASRYDGELFTGRFPDFDTRISFDPARPEAGKLDVSIGLASAVTGNGDRDSTLKTADFFDVARFAQARYTANGFRKLADGQYAADGTLELRGVRKPVTLTFTWTAGAQPVLAGKAVVKRLEFGVGGGDWDDTDTIPDAVNISTRVVLKPL
jgi:polyisoprenoid-binding protein YceI